MRREVRRESCCVPVRITASKPSSMMSTMRSDRSIDIDLSERMVDIIEEGFDAVIRTGTQHDSRLTSRRIGSCKQVVVAAPSYLAQHGTPAHPRELARHAC